jgi:hypothetical protein
MRSEIILKDSPVSKYQLKVEELSAAPQGFLVTSTPINEMEVDLDYVLGVQQSIHFGSGYTLKLRPYRGNNAQNLSLEYNLTNPGHPLNDATVGVARGTCTISTGSEVISYFNFYVNTSLTTKLRIRLEKVA